MATHSPLFLSLGSMPSAKPENLVILIMKKNHVLLKTSLLNILSCCFSVTAELLSHFSNVNDSSGVWGRKAPCFPQQYLEQSQVRIAKANESVLTLRSRKKSVQDFMLSKTVPTYTSLSEK